MYMYRKQLQITSPNFALFFQWEKLKNENYIFLKMFGSHSRELILIKKASKIKSITFQLLRTFTNVKSRIDIDIKAVDDDISAHI